MTLHPPVSTRPLPHLVDGQWVTYRSAPRPDDRTAKIPMAAYGRSARVNDPSTWSSLSACIAAVEAGRADGIAYVLTGDGVVVLDLDHAFPAAAALAVRCGDLSPLSDLARWVVERADSYTEISPSQSGLHIWLRASLPTGCRNRAPGIEAYDRARMITVTGEHVAGTPTAIEPRQPDVEAIVVRYLTPRRMPTPPASCAAPPYTATRADDDVLARARAAANGAKFVALYDRGDLSLHAGDHSAADLALARMLAYWCAGDVVQINRLFRASKLMRPKWDARHGATTYGARTITVAVAKGITP